MIRLARTAVIVIASVATAGIAGVTAVPANAITPPAGGGYNQLAPARILDTRIGVGAPTGAVAAGGHVALTVLGHGGVPASGVSAVALHVTVTSPSAPGYLTAWPAGHTRPVASSLNFASGETISNTVLVEVGTGGVVDLYNGSTGTAQFIADVSGWVDNLGGDGRGAFGTLTPARLLDTRIGLGAPMAPLAPGATIHLAVVGHGGVPAMNDGFGYAAAVLNVAAINPNGAGYITVWGDDASRPATSNLNLAVGQTRANLVVAPIGSGGGVKIYNGSTKPVQLIADVSGYFSGGLPNAQNQFTNVGPTRVLDTRTTVGAIGPGGSVSFSLGTQFPISAGVLNLTVTSPTGTGYLTAWADGTTRPNTSSLNFTTGETIAGLNLVPVGTNGRVDIYNGSTGSVQIIADESGLVTGCC